MAAGFRFALVAVLAISAFLEAPAFGQRGGAGTSPSPGGNTPPGGTSPGVGTSPGTGRAPSQTPTQPQQQQPNITRPIFLSGRVMLEDGTPPPGRVAIQRLCGAIPRTEGYTDSRGYFNIELGSNFSDALQDASTSGFNDPTDPFSNNKAGRLGGAPQGVSERDLIGCELRAQLAGYQSQSVNLSGHRELDNPDVGVILLHRIGGSEGTTISATTLSAPKDARKAYEKGLNLAKKNKLDEAQSEFQKAVDAYPRYATAWYDLGRIQEMHDHLDDARHSFAQSIQADAKFVLPYVEMARLELRAGHWQELADTSEKAVRLDPINHPDAFFWNAVANYNLHRVDAAEESARRAQKLDSRHQMPQVWHLLGVILAERKDFPAAAEQMRDYLKFAPGAKDATTVRSQLEQIEKLAQAAPAPAQQ